MFVRNAWYVAAWDHEVTRDHEAPHPARRAGGAVSHATTASRSRSRTAAATGRRRSRWASWSATSCKCPYHGLQFDSTGKCVKVPSQDMVPPSAKVQRLSGGRAQPLDLDLDGRPGQGRPRADRGLPLAGRPGVALRRQLPARRGELPAAGREPARHDAPAVPASEHARHRRLRALRVRGEARRRPHHGDALADERAAGAVPQADGRASPTA